MQRRAHGKLTVYFSKVKLKLVSIEVNYISGLLLNSHISGFTVLKQICDMHLYFKTFCYNTNISLTNRLKYVDLLFNKFNEFQFPTLMRGFFVK